MKVKPEKRRMQLPMLLVGLVLFSQISFAQDSLLSPAELKKLSLEDLMNIEVTSVSKRPEKLSGVASAIQVITQEDIRNSGAKTIPEALRLSPNLHVAQVNSSQWAISARGFNNVLANKLLVLIDGRTVYTPLYAGVFWDVQNLLLEDVDRIEVISGPGGTLWGANAVNGVINIITKSAKNTKGIFAEAAYGTAFPGAGSLRFGSNINENLSYRVYGTGFKMASTYFTDSIDAEDQWTMGQGGFRLDWDHGKKDVASLQATIYSGKPNPDGKGGIPVIAKGDNAILKWAHTISDKAGFQVQAYYDHTWRDFGNDFTENLRTYDLDWQNRYQLGQRHTVTYGLGARLMDHRVENLALFRFLPERKVLHLYSLFLQDDIVLIKERLRFTLGTKLEHNSYTGFEYQPNGRLMYTPTDHHTIWVAVSRAVRTPSRIDREFSLSAFQNFPVIEEGGFISEELLAYELGWRFQPNKKLHVSVATFYNLYDNIRSAEPGPPPYALPLTFANGVKGEALGAEISATSQLTSWWRLRGGYTYFEKHLMVKPISKDQNDATAESNDPAHQFLIQSSMNLWSRIELGAVLRYVDKLPEPYIPGYFGLDARIGWKVNKFLELDLIAQNLLDEAHTEFIPSSPVSREVQRSVYAKIICRF